MPNQNSSNPCTLTADLFEADQSTHTTVAEQASDSNELWLTAPDLAFRKWKLSQRTSRKEFASHSVEQYQTMFGAYLRWLASHGIELDKALPEHLDLFLTSKQGRDGRPAAASTRRRYLHLLHGIYEHLRLMELRKDNPAAPLIDLTKNQSFERPAPAILPFELGQRFIHWTLSQSEQEWHELRDKAIRMAFIGSGIRVHELQALHPKDFISMDGLAAFEIPAHGFVKARLNPISDTAIDAIKKWKGVLAKMQPDGEFLFPARFFANGHDYPEDTPVASDEAFRIVQEAMTAIGYDRSRQGPQTLRNTFIARQIWEGKPHARIMDWCGLQTIDSIQKIAKMVPIRADGVVPS